MAEVTCDVLPCRDARNRLQALDLMLREANHRIANSLQAVMAASATDAGRNSVAPGSARAQMTMRISAIAVVHRMLSASTADTIAIGDYLANLAESIGVLWSGPGATRIAVHHGDEKVAADVAMRLGMVVNELVTNSLKYAYDNNAGGEIRVAFSVMEGSFVLIVADDGRGMDGPSARRRGSGSRLVEDIAAQLDASFSYQSARPGTIAVLSGSADVLLPRGGNARIISVPAVCPETSPSHVLLDGVTS